MCSAFVSYYKGAILSILIKHTPRSPTGPRSLPPRPLPPPDIILSSTVQDLGVVLDRDLFLTNQVSSVCHSCFHQLLRQLCSICHCLSFYSVPTFIHALIVVRVDISNAVFAGLSLADISKLQCDQASFMLDT